MRIFTLILGLLCTLGYSSGYNYLMVLNSAGRSHFNVGHALAKGLVKAGHTITVVSVFPQKKPIPGYTDVNVTNVVKVMGGDIGSLWASIQKPFTQNLIDLYGFLSTITCRCTNAF
ncbi:GM26129 [Drosophila sechellia]|uniref:GM26129 n=1 Tax=Drosophila sechellia TaxID=7238 RepID=B4HIE7_DROSE|nr:GM26129 [Drosophila sechellia]